MGYLTASVLYIANLFVRSTRPAVLATLVSCAAVLAHTVGLFQITMQTGRSPYSTVYGSVGFVAWLIVLMQLVLVWRWRMYATGAFSLPIAGLMLLFALALPPEMRQLLPDLRRQSLAAHISVILLGYGAFAVAFGLSLIYLMEERLLKARRLQGLFERLPPLRVTESVAFGFAAFGQAMLTLGLAIGLVWAQEMWTKRLWQDPKVIPSLVTWGVYSVYLLLRGVSGWRGRPAAWLLVVGFCAVLVTLVGVNALFPGRHGLPY
ncbi:MAG: cytochrome c biogenesis protein CcsA [Armatimonadota bacterium]|nr:cytochrome c biogenesis protein CcsA [Armatimonadota bacterium]